MNLKTKSSTLPHPCGCQSKAQRDVLAKGLTAKMERERVLVSFVVDVVVDIKSVSGT